MLNNVQSLGSIIDCIRMCETNTIHHSPFRYYCYLHSLTLYAIIHVSNLIDYRNAGLPWNESNAYQMCGGSCLAW